MKVSLHTSVLPALAHEAVALPWLAEAARFAPRTRQPVLVLVPLQADAYYLKTRALAAGFALPGVQFLTPGQIRDRLALHLGLGWRVPLREHLRLLLATAAERCGDEARGVAASPDTLLKAVDLLSAGGWDFEHAGPPAMRLIVTVFYHQLANTRFTLVHQADRELRARAAAAQPFTARLLVTGFNALHWPLWPLLEAAVRSAEEVTVCLTEPRQEGEALDAAWVGTWEETFGASSPLPGDSIAPFVEWLRLPESAEEITHRRTTPTTAMEFLVGQDTAQQAQAIVAQIVRWTGDSACERLGVLFPSAGALARRVALLLAELDILHHDGLAHTAPGPLEDAAWPAWLALQENPRLPALLTFLRARSAESFGELTLDEVEDALPRIFADLLLDDLSVAASWLEAHPRRRHAPALAAALRALPWLPERTELGKFATRTGTIFRELGWTERAAELDRLAADWRDAWRLTISRRTWLRWLRETLVSTRLERASQGRHPYSRVHLLPYAQAESQSWTHLIAADLNDGHWPPTLEDSGFFGEEEIAALNSRLRTLNTRATAQGGQGEGHVALQAGHTLCLGPAQRRELTLRQFLATLESTTVAVTATAQLVDESAPERRLNPGDFFTRLYFCARGRGVSPEIMEALQTNTARWLHASGLWPTSPPDPVAGRATRIAYDARRDAVQPFGEYEFSLRTAPPVPLTLAATEWEAVFSSPSLVWMTHQLGVGARGAHEETPWEQAVGQWVHRWLGTLATPDERGGFAPLPSSEEMCVRIRTQAAAFRDSVHALLAANGRPLPDWWLSTWQQAQQIALQLARRLGAVTGRTHLATEWKLPDTVIPIESDDPLHVHGRLDLILAAAACAGGEVPEDAWIVDFKTGNRQPLNTKRLRRGEGVQLALYALALHQRGAGTTGASLLTPDLALEAPQLSLAELAAETRLWRGLARMGASGVFGQRGALRDEFAFRNDHPLATLAIDPEVLEEKWALTHPDLAGGEEPV